MTEATRPQPPTARPVVAVYRNGLLLPTETYIRAQGEALTRYGSYYVGMHRIPRGLELPGERVFVLNQGGRTGLAREFVYQETGFSPRLVKAIRRPSGEKTGSPPPLSEICTRPFGSDNDVM